MWPPFDRMPVEVREVLLDMSFQLGPAGVLGFHHMLAALAADDWDGRRQTAALASKWARETPARAKHAAQVFRNLR